MEKVLVYGTNKYIINKVREFGYYAILCDENRLDDAKFADEFKYVSYKDFEWNLEMAKREKIVGVVCATDFAVVLCAYLCEQLGFPTNSIESCKLAKNKYEVRKLLKEIGAINVQQFFAISNIKELRDIKDEIKFPVILKPADSGGSVFTYKISNYDELEEKVEEVIYGSKNNVALVESFIKGEEYSVEAFVHEGKPYILAMTKREMTELPYRVTLSHTCPPCLPEKVEKDVEDTISNLIKHLGIKMGAMNFDVIISDVEKEVFIIDTNPRVGGNGMSTHVVKLSTGIDQIDNVVRASLGLGGIDLTPKCKKKVYIRVINLDEGVLKRDPDLDKYLDDEIVCIDFAKKAGEKSDKFISLAQRAGIIVACGDDLDKLKEKADRIRDLINQEVYE